MKALFTSPVPIKYVEMNTFGEAQKPLCKISEGGIPLEKAKE